MGCKGRGVETTIWISFRCLVWLNVKEVVSVLWLGFKLQNLYYVGPTLDVDWRNNVSFATSSTDNMIYVCKIGENRPIKTFAGHQVCSWIVLLIIIIILHQISVPLLENTWGLVIITSIFFCEHMLQVGLVNFGVEGRLDSSLDLTLF